MRSNSKWHKLGVSMGLLAAVGMASCADTDDDLSNVTDPSGAEGEPLAMSSAAGRDGEIRALPVYDVIETGIDEARAGRLAAALGLTDNALDSGRGVLGGDGAMRYLDAERFQKVPTRAIPAQPGRPDERGRPTAPTTRAIDFDALASLRVLPEDVAVARVRAALAGAGLPALRGISVTHSTFEAVTKEGVARADAPLDTQVNGEFALEGLRLVGPGAKVKVVFDGEGVVTQMVHAARTLARGEEVAIVPPSQADRLCAEAFGGMENLSVTSELVYYAPPLAQKVSRIYPHYACGGTATVEGREIALRRIMIPALVDRSKAGVTAEESSLMAAPQPSSASAAGTSVGTEWIGTCGGLGGSSSSANGFANVFKSKGASVPFNNGEFDAKEKHFKDPNKGGNDDLYADSVDMTFFTGHADSEGFYFCSSTTDQALTYQDARWGQTGVEWMVVAACGPLQGTNADGLNAVERWGRAFVGLHLLLAYANTSYDNVTEGPDLANYLLVNQLKVRNAWVQAATNAQPAETTYAFMGTYGVDDAMPNYDDFFWEQGPVGADQTGDEIEGFWRIKGGC
ncbi:DUF6345 domain-containing protein [Polyangium aurulentum]|uniref:DUF6345 domain-containing protein n=1 Tax=Polyangium aurulentum TaxID=2567896 RepID=UPI0010ADD54F|nr:DUF6345 domain-containing protein [Polyangium aurulentum]UQA56751.1 hypothetical protein E8A73_036435 [Polyangium aurulentum]